SRQTLPPPVGPRGDQALAAGAARRVPGLGSAGRVRGDQPLSERRRQGGSVPLGSRETPRDFRDRREQSRAPAPPALPGAHPRGGPLILRDGDGGPAGTARPFFGVRLTY